MREIPRLCPGTAPAENHFGTQIREHFWHSLDIDSYRYLPYISLETPSINSYLQKAGEGAVKFAVLYTIYATVRM